MTFDTLAQIGLTDLVTTRGIYNARTRLYPKSARHANYMFVRGNLEIRGFQALAKSVVSAHRALVLDLV